MNRLIALISLAAGLWQQYPENTSLTDPVAQLQARLERGEVQLKFESSRGYLNSVLSGLKIPMTSQSLVFSKTSLQTDFISPSTPRALFFNDDVYVAWVPDAPMLEIASVDPQYGTIFYVMSQAEGDAPAFRRLKEPCTTCHAPARDEVPSPLLLMMTAAIDITGEPVSEFQLVTDRTPFSDRWGGWYVNASRGSPVHRGNKVVAGGTTSLLFDPSSASRPFNTFRYPSPSSDIVALMLLSHQVDVHNRINEAAQQTRALPASAPQEKIAEAVEPLVRALLFSGAAPLPEPIRGPSEFAREFTASGRKDSRGRSLKELDLDRRLLRYPLSYLVYSESFDQMPQAARDYVYRRLFEILSRKDRSEDFAHLTDADRSSLLEILPETKPEFAAWIKKQ
jgi:hypothetical protein